MCLMGYFLQAEVSKAPRLNFTLGFSDPLVSASGFIGISLAAGFFAAASVFAIVASNDRCREGLEPKWLRREVRACVCLHAMTITEVKRQ